MARLGTALALFFLGVSPNLAATDSHVDSVKASVKRVAKVASKMARKVASQARRLQMESDSRQTSSSRRLEDMGNYSCLWKGPGCYLNFDFHDSQPWQTDLKDAYLAQWECETRPEGTCSDVPDGTCKMEATGCSMDTTNVEGGGALMSSFVEGCGLLGTTMEAAIYCGSLDNKSLCAADDKCIARTGSGAVGGNCVEIDDCEPNVMKWMCPDVPDRTEEEQDAFNMQCYMNSANDQISMMACMYQGCSEDFIHLAQVSGMCQNTSMDFCQDTCQPSEFGGCEANTMNLMTHSMGEECKLRAFAELTVWCEEECVSPYCASYFEEECYGSSAGYEERCDVSVAGSMLALGTHSVSDALIFGNMMMGNAQCLSMRGEEEACKRHTHEWMNEDEFSMMMFDMVEPSPPSSPSPSHGGGTVEPRRRRSPSPSHGGGGHCLEVSEGEARSFDEMGLKLRTCDDK